LCVRVRPGVLLGGPAAAREDEGTAEREENERKASHRASLATDPRRKALQFSRLRARNAVLVTVRPRAGVVEDELQPAREERDVREQEQESTSAHDVPPS